MATDAQGAAQSGGMPQLDITTFPNQMFWLVIALVAIYLVLTRIALPRIGGVLAERKGTITNDLAAAEELKQKAKEAEASYNQALVDARAEAGRIIAEAKAEAQANLDKETAKADAEIAARVAESSARIAEIRASAVESVGEVAKEAAKDIVALLGGKADARSITAAITSRMKG